MRRAAKIDANHVQVVLALEAAGATVQSLAAVGQGVPDLLVGFQGKTLLMEIKDGKKDRKSTRLNSSHMSESRMPSSA